MFKGVWCGKNVPKTNRILIMGESHYDSEELTARNTAPEYTTSDVVRCYLEKHPSWSSFFDRIAESFGYSSSDRERFYSKVYFGNYVEELCGVGDDRAQKSIKRNRDAYNTSLFNFINDNEIDILICFTKESYNNLPSFASSGETAGSELIGKIGESGKKHNNAEYCNYVAGVEHAHCDTVLKKTLKVYAFVHPTGQYGFNPSQVYEYCKKIEALKELINPVNQPVLNHIEAEKQKIFSDAEVEVRRLGLWFTDDQDNSYKAEASGERINRLCAKTEKKCKENGWVDYYINTILPAIIAAADDVLWNGWNKNVVTAYSEKEFPEVQDLADLLQRARFYFNVYSTIFKEKNKTVGLVQSDVPMLKHSQEIMRYCYDAQGYVAKKGLFRTKWVPSKTISESLKRDFMDNDQILENKIAKLIGKEASKLYNQQPSKAQKILDNPAIEVAASYALGKTVQNANKQAANKVISILEKNRKPFSETLKEHDWASGHRIPFNRNTCYTCAYWNGERKIEKDYILVPQNAPSAKCSKIVGTVYVAKSNCRNWRPLK